MENLTDTPARPATSRPGCSSTGQPVTGLASWDGGGLEETAGLINFRVGAWNGLEYPENVPPLGQRNAAAITAGHGAIEAIDELVRDLHALRGQLVDELRGDEDARAVRVDKMLAKSRAGREAGR